MNNIEALSNVLDISKNQIFTYDKTNRLKKATGSYGEYSYSYDAAGNRTERIKNIGASTSISTEKYAYALDSNQLNTVTTTNSDASTDARTFIYAANGQLINDKNKQRTHALNYNNENRLDQINTGAQTAEYRHNALGQRVKKVVKDSKASVIKQIHYHYDNRGQLIAETDALGKVIREYVYVNDHAVAIIIGATMYYVHNDHLGAPRLLTDQLQAKVWEVQTTPFGEVHEEVAGGIEQIKGFPGQYFDGESGLYYSYYRDYDSALGRYIQGDPIGLRGGLNAYGYVSQNPLRYIDPLGLLTVNFGFNGTGVIGDTGTNPGGVYGQGVYVKVNSIGVEIGIYVTSGDAVGGDIDGSVVVGVTPNDTDFNGRTGSIGADIGPVSGNVNINPDTGEIIGGEIGVGPGYGGSYSETVTASESAFSFPWPRGKSYCSLHPGASICKPDCP